MTDLKLNHQAMHFVRNQLRCSEYLELLAKMLDFEYAAEKDNYIAPQLISNRVAQLICQSLGAEVGSQSSGELFDVLDEKITQGQKEEFAGACASLDAFLRRQKAEEMVTLDLQDYRPFVLWLSKSLEVISHFEGFPQYDFNSDRIILDYQANNDEIKLMILLFGTQTLEVYDNNKQLDKKFNIFSNNLWASYLIQVISIAGLQLVAQNLPFFGNYLGATSSQITGFTLYFNLVQLFFLPIWLSVSDIIGRKVVMIIIQTWYVIITAVMLGSINMGNQKAITYLSVCRAFSGISAIVQPLGYLIVADLAPPNYRGIVMIVTNCFSQLGVVITSLINILLTSGKKYSTKDVPIGSDDYNDRTKMSFKNGLIVAIAFYAAAVLISIFCFKESSSRLKAKRDMKKLGVVQKADKVEKPEPLGKVLKSMVTNKDIVVMFFSYIFSVIGAVNSRVGVNIFVQKAYGFGTINESKKFSNVVTIIGVVISTLLSAFTVGPMLKSLGEVKVIVGCQYFSMIESVVNYAVDQPIPKWIVYITQTIISISLLFCDTIFLQLISQLTSPQNKGQVMGIFQIGNAVARIMASFVTGKFMDYNIREAQMFNCLFSSTSLILLGFFTAPLQRHEMDKKAKLMKEEAKKVESI